MRLLIISDSHRHSDTLKKIILSQPNAEEIFFLGDVTNDIESLTHIYTNRHFHIVSGNCDFLSKYPTTSIVTLNSKKIFLTHGHTLGVKSSVSYLLKAAKQQECNIALFGHTHIPYISYTDGIYTVNPGSCALSRNGRNSYAVIDIEPNGIMPIIIEL